jgi:hypothetical protein
MREQQPKRTQAQLHTLQWGDACGGLGGIDLEGLPTWDALRADHQPRGPLMAHDEQGTKRQVSHKGLPSRVEHQPSLTP